MIFEFEIEAAINKLRDSGVKVSPETHAIYAGPGTKFFGEIYPLPIVFLRDGQLPSGVACVVSIANLPQAYKETFEHA